MLAKRPNLFSSASYWYTWSIIWNWFVIQHRQAIQFHSEQIRWIHSELYKLSHQCINTLLHNDMQKNPIQTNGISGQIAENNLVNFNMIITLNTLLARKQQAHSIRININIISLLVIIISITTIVIMIIIIISNQTNLINNLINKIMIRWVQAAIMISAIFWAII